MKNKINTIKADITAGIVVFLVALPLCLGIAQASGVNGFSGIITGVIGGMIVTIFSKSKFGVSGPAAGMITIVLAAVANLSTGGFLLALAIAGIIQFLLGQFKLGFIGYFFPNSVIKGMLASIGVILILKQFPHALGFDAARMGEYGFKDQEGSNTFSAIVMAVRYYTIGAVIISIISFAIMFAWNSKFLSRFNFFKLVPASVVVVTVGILVNMAYKNFFPSMRLETFHMVQLPYELTVGLNSIMAGNFTNVSDYYGNLINFPDLKQLSNSAVWTSAITIALVASIQTLLSVEATDNLDPEKNLTPTNPELKAQGIGNFISGLVGGLPIAQVIVRSTANINAGAKSKKGSVFHGVFLLFAVFLFPRLLNMIPLASLAVILILLGYKLVNVKLIIDTWKKGMAQFIPFVVTLVAIIFSDMLTGVGIGMAVALITIFRTNYNTAYTIERNKSGKLEVAFRFVVSFLNKGSLALRLHEIPEHTEVIFNAKKCHFISHDNLEIIRDFSTIIAKRKDISVEFKGFERYGFTDQAEMSSSHEVFERSTEKLSVA